MADSIGSASDSELLLMAEQFFNTISPTPATFGLTAGQSTALQTQTQTFSNALDDHTAARTAALAATQNKETERDTLEALLRSYRNIAKAGGTSPANMANLGIPPASNFAPETATIPAGTVDTSVRLRHKISFVDSGANGNKKKPRGVVGCEIWMKVGGPPPTDEKDCSFLTLDTATPYVADFDGAQANQMAHYMLRWAMRDGSKGGWGETVSATITG